MQCRHWPRNMTAPPPVGAVAGHSFSLVTRTDNSAGTTTIPSCHPVCRRPTRMWSGLAPWCPGGAPHWTNDLDTRGQGCSALPGTTADGMTAPTSATIKPVPAGWTVAIPVPGRSPCRRHRSDLIGWNQWSAALRLNPSGLWARGVAGALERGGDRSGGASDAPRARRSVSDDGP